MDLKSYEFADSITDMETYADSYQKINQRFQDLGIDQNTEFILKPDDNVYLDKETQNKEKLVREIILLRYHCARVILPEVRRWNEILELKEETILEWEGIISALFKLLEKKADNRTWLTLHQQGDFVFGATFPHAQTIARIVTEAQKTNPIPKRLKHIKNRYRISNEDYDTLLDYLVQENGLESFDLEPLPPHLAQHLGKIRELLHKKVTITAHTKSGVVEALFEE